MTTRFPARLLAMPLWAGLATGLGSRSGLTVALRPAGEHTDDISAQNVFRGSSW